MTANKPATRDGIFEPCRGDVPAMCEIFKSGQIYHQNLFPDIFCAPDNEEKICAYIQGFTKPRNPFRTRRKFSYACFNNDVLEGYVLFQLYNNSNVFFKNDRWFAHIEDIAVGENFRKNGTASKLMNSLISRVDGLGGGVISGQVWRGNEASGNLFAKSGFSSHAQDFYRVL